MILYVTADCEIDNEKHKKGDVIEVSPVKGEYFLSEKPRCFNLNKPAPKKRKKAKEKDNV